MGEAGGLSKSVSGGLAGIITNHFGLPVVGQTIHDLATSNPGFIRNFLCGHGSGSLTQSFNNLVMVLIVQGAIGIGFRLTLGQFGGQFILDGEQVGQIVVVDVVNEGFHRRFLHSGILSGFVRVFLLFIFRSYCIINFVVCQEVFENFVLKNFRSRAMRFLSRQNPVFVFLAPSDNYYYTQISVKVNYLF